MIPSDVPEPKIWVLFMVLTCVVVLSGDIVLARFMLFARVMVLTRVMVLAHVMVLTCDGWGCGPHGLSARRA